MRVFLALSFAVGVFCHGAFPASAYDVVPVSNGGAIKGKVVYNGVVPTRTVLPTKDEKICGGPRKEPLIRLGADKGVQEVVLAIQNIDKGKAWGASAPTPVLDNKDCLFLPHVQVIPGGKLAVLNSDPVLHNTHGFYGKRTAFNLALPNQGQRIDVELPRPGAVRIECDSHGWMLGWVHVVDNPYFAVTDDSGGFEIRDIPPGKYTLVATQEDIGAVNFDLEVKAGETITLPIELKK